MTYAPQSKDNSNPQHQQQTIKATVQTFSDNRESTSVSLPLHAMMANSPQQQKLKSTAQLMANSPVQQKLNIPKQNFANRSEPMQRMEEEEPLQGRFETESQPAQLEASPEAPRPNNTGLPDNLKAGIENLSGMSMDHVRVHYNSDKPAQLQAHAYAQGSEIHVAPGQEQHLPHEAWHVVQQAQGRVKPTMQMKGNVQVNDDAGLEAEADLMGERAVVQGRGIDRAQITPENVQVPSPAIQRLRVGVVPNNPATFREYTNLSGWSGATVGRGAFNGSDLNHIRQNNMDNAPDNPPAPNLEDEVPVSDANRETLLNPIDSRALAPEVDHIVPVAQAGANDWDNARVISKGENTDGTPARPGAAAKRLRTYESLVIVRNDDTHNINAGDNLSTAQVILLNRYAGNGNNTQAISEDQVDEILAMGDGTEHGVSVNDSDSEMSE